MEWFLEIMVAGARIARASQGYEPREVLLLYPAQIIPERGYFGEEEKYLLLHPAIY